MVGIRSKTDNVALIRSDIDDCELAIKASQSRKSLSLFQPFFDRKAELSLRSEVERGNRMNYERDSPVIDEQVQRTEVGQIEIPGVVVRGEIRGASIFEISDIVNRKAVSFTSSVSEDRNLRLPIGILSWTQRQPPAGDACKTEENQNPSAQCPKTASATAPAAHTSEAIVRTKEGAGKSKYSAPAAQAMNNVAIKLATAIKTKRTTRLKKRGPQARVDEDWTALSI